MRLSIVIAVLNSHEIVRRQVLHFEKMGVPAGVEIILVDDGSDPPIQAPFRIHRTNDTRPWTWALARNAGARIATGEYLLMTDIDYIIPRQAILDACSFTGDKMRFQRESGVLDENGEFTQDLDVLRSYGLSEERIKTRGRKLPPHPNNFVMRRELFLDMGGYVEDRVGQPYPQREDSEFKRRWTKWVADGKAKDSDYRSKLYMFPNGQFCGDVDYNPFGLFHNLSRRTSRNPLCRH